MKIEIPKYIRRVKLSEKQREKYFFWDGVTIKAKGKQVFKRFIKNEFYPSINKDTLITPYHLTDDVVINAFIGTTLIGTFAGIGKPIHSFENVVIKKQDRNKGTVYILCYKETGEKVIANPTQVGKPRKIIISGQDLYSGNVADHTRNKVMTTIKLSLFPYVKDVPTFPIQSYPLRCRLYIYDTLKSMFDNSKNDTGRRWDVINRGYPYMKAMMDLLSTGLAGENKMMEPIIRDDDRLHLTEDGSCIFVPIKNYEERKLQFVFWSDLSGYPNDEILEIEKYRQNQLKLFKDYTWFQNQENDININENDLWL